MTELKNCTTNFFPELCGINVVVDPQARLGTDDDRVLIIGTSTGTATSGLHQFNSATSASLFGANSMLSQQVEEFKSSCPTAEIWVYAVPNTGTAGDVDVTFAGVAAATVSGNIYLWVNGRAYATTFDPTVDTDATVAVRFASAITAGDTSLTVTSTAGVLNITTIGLGAIGGFLDVRTSYGVRPDLVTSSQITVTKTVTTSTGVPNLSGLASLSQGFEFVVNPFTDDASIAVLSTYLCGQWSGGVNSRAYGVFYGTVNQAKVFGQNANNGLMSYMAINGALTPPYLESAAYGCIAYRGLNCQSGAISESLTGKVMPLLLAPEFSDRYTPFDQAALIESGMGYFNVNRINDVTIGRAVTTYTVADNGTLDNSLSDVNRPALIACMSKFMRNELTARFTGYAFRTDGVVGGNATKVATIGAIENFMIGLGQRMSDRNWLQDLSGFIDNMTVTVNPDNGCVEIAVSPELVKQFCCATVILRTR